MQPRPAIARPYREEQRDAVGSTLFLDDNLAALRRALPPADRARWSDRLLSAFILLFGRPRVTLFSER